MLLVNSHYNNPSWIQFCQSWIQDFWSKTTPEASRTWMTRLESWKAKFQWALSWPGPQSQTRTQTILWSCLMAGKSATEPIHGGIWDGQISSNINGDERFLRGSYKMDVLATEDDQVRNNRTNGKNLCTGERAQPQIQGRLIIQRRRKWQHVSWGMGLLVQRGFDTMSTATRKGTPPTQAQEGRQGRRTSGLFILWKSFESYPQIYYGLSNH